MQKMLLSAALATVLATGSAIAQTPPPPATPPASTVIMDATAEAKFKAADKDNNGILEGAEVEAYKTDMAKIDTNKDGKISRDEFAVAVKNGLIK